MVDVGGLTVERVFILFFRSLTSLPIIPHFASHPPWLMQVGSHYHFVETNPLLFFDRQLAYGYRLNILPGTAVRFEVGFEDGSPLVHCKLGTACIASSLHSSPLNLTEDQQA